MPKKVTWKKGMRLSESLFNASDDAFAELVRQASNISASGRFGLFRGVAPFEISLNITGSLVDVTSLNCNGITRSGQIVDISYRSSYGSTFDTKVGIPSGNPEDAYLLLVRMHPGEWREVGDVFSEAYYTFEVIGMNSPLGDNCLPIASLVNQFGWRMNEDDFVPPCLWVNAHPKFVDQRRRAYDLLSSIRSKCSAGRNSAASTLIGFAWRNSSAAAIRLDKERDTLTPEELFSIIQSFVSEFTIGCAIDKYISLENEAEFEQFSLRPLDGSRIYRDIEDGLALCSEISVKMEAVGKIVAEVPRVEEKPKPKPKPVPEEEISEEERRRRRWSGINI